MDIFSKIKEGENYNHRNTLKYFEDYNFEPDEEIGGNSHSRIAS